MKKSNFLVEKFIGYIVRPKRMEYCEADLGYPIMKFNNLSIIRTDEVIINKRK